MSTPVQMNKIQKSKKNLNGLKARQSKRFIKNSSQPKSHFQKKIKYKTKQKINNNQIYLLKKIPIKVKCQG